MGCKTIEIVFEGISGTDKGSKVNKCVKITQIFGGFKNCIYLCVKLTHNEGSESKNSNHGRKF